MFQGFYPISHTAHSTLLLTSLRPEMTLSIKMRDVILVDKHPLGRGCLSRRAFAAGGSCGGSGGGGSRSFRRCLSPPLMHAPSTACVETRRRTLELTAPTTETACWSTANWPCLGCVSHMAAGV